MEEAIRLGKRIHYRTIREIEEQKAKKYTNPQFLRWDVTSTLKVQATNMDALAQELMGEVKDIKALDGGTTKVVDNSGSNVLRGLFKSDPFRSKDCPF